MESNQQEPKGAEGGAEGGHHPQSTTIGTIVVQGGPLQLVIAVLQVCFFLWNFIILKLKIYLGEVINGLLTF